MTPANSTTMDDGRGCRTCGSIFGHKINCPHGIAFTKDMDSPTEQERGGQVRPDCRPMGSKERESIARKFNSPDIPKWKKELIAEVEESMKKHGKNDFYGVHDLYGAICLIDETDKRATASCSNKWRGLIQGRIDDLRFWCSKHCRNFDKHEGVIELKALLSTGAGDKMVDVPPHLRPLAYLESISTGAEEKEE